MPQPRRQSPRMMHPQASARLAADSSRPPPSPAGTAELANAGAVLTIDLGAIRENYRRLKARLGTVACAAVVKADAYGLGAARVAPALRAEGCETFFVALVQEGIALRRILGPVPTIHVLNGVPPGAEGDALRAGLSPVINSLEQLAAWRGVAGRTPPVALQVDGGMARLGMTPAEVEALAADPGLLGGIPVALVMSHLACADEPDHPANAAQARSFDALRARLPKAPSSLANSSGIFLGASYHHDLARPGAALYGINPMSGGPNPMLPVVRLSAKIVQTRSVGAGDGVGYALAYRAAGPMRLATISLGYADGWPRHATGGVWRDDVHLPIVGRVSMDSIILDVTGLPEDSVRAGDLVDLVGAHQSVDQVAAVAGTIGYEILTGLGSRFHRRYLDEAAVETS